MIRIAHWKDLIKSSNKWTLNTRGNADGKGQQLRARSKKPTTTYVMTQTTILYWHRQKPSTQVKIGNPFLPKRTHSYEAGGEGGAGNCLIPQTPLFPRTQDKVQLWSWERKSKATCPLKERDRVVGLWERDSCTEEVPQWSSTTQGQNTKKPPCSHHKMCSK